jgi:glycosyltransferase involved in cell wall biosynthesis
MHVVDSLGRGGAENLVIGLSHEMSLRQHETCIISLTDLIAYDDLVKKYNLRVYCCHFKGTIYSLLAIFRASRLLKKAYLEFQPDVINTHIFLSDIVSRLTLGKRVSIVTTLHRNEMWWKSPRGLIKKLKRWLEKTTALRYTKQFIAVSETTKSEAEAYLGIAPITCHIIKNGVNTDVFAPRVAITAPGSHSAPKIIQVARFYPEKNHELSLNAFKRVAAKIPDAELWLIGDGPDLNKLKKMATELELDRNVHFLGLRSDIKDLLVQCHVFWLTSKREGLPISLLEAMACGLPPVVSNVGDIPRVVQDQVNGYLIEHDSEQNFSDKTCELLTDRKLYAKLSAAAVDTIREKFSISETTSNYLRVYQMAVGS